MTTATYQTWIHKNRLLKGAGYPVKILFYQAIELGERLKRQKTKHQIETSFNSRDKQTLLKITHIFHLFRCKKETITAFNFIEGEKLISFIDNINKILNLKFNLEIFRYLLKIPQSPILAKEQALIINFDLKIPNQEFKKISIAFNPQQIKQIEEVFKKTIPLKQIYGKKNLAFINIDFYNDGKISFKIYYFYKKLPLKFNMRELQRDNLYRIFRVISKKVMPPHYIFIMQKFNPLKNKLIFGGAYFCYDENLSALKLKKIIKIGFNIKYNSFLKEVCNQINNFNISFLAFKPKNLIEVYFR